MSSAAEGGGRLDAVLATRGLARSRTHAARLIEEGRVTVDGHPATKASLRVAAASSVQVAGDDHYVSRAAHKLIAGLDAFGVDPKGREALDVGASTGGFTQVLLERGASRVIALDVGHGQLVPEIARDPRVDVVEGFNARELSPVSLAAAIGRESEPSLVVADVSFISLALLLPAVVSTASAAADLVVLIKPQFEVGRTGIKEGVVHNSDLRTDAVTNVLWSAWDAGLGTAGIISSPIAGTHGNREYVAHLSVSGSNPTEWLEQVSLLCR